MAQSWVWVVRYLDLATLSLISSGTTLTRSASQGVRVDNLLLLSISCLLWSSSGSPTVQCAPETLPQSHCNLRLTESCLLLQDEEDSAASGFG